MNTVTFDNQILMEADSSTNFMTEDMFNKFLWGLVRLVPFHSPKGRPPMNEWSFAMLFETLYSCGLRVSEAFNLTRDSLDLDHRIIRIKDAKTGKGKIQKTSILPRTIPLLKAYTEDLDHDDLLFPTNRQMAWRYAKNVKDIGKELLELALSGQQTNGRFEPNLKNRIIELIKIHGATDQEIDQLYNHVVFELLTEQSKEQIQQ